MSTQLEEKLNKILIEKKEKILPENIKKGIKLFDVDGSLEILDTSDADATAKDIAMNKTAYVNGKKITGTLLEPSMSSISTDNIIDTGSRVDIEGKMPTDYLFRKNSSITYNIKYPSLANAIGLTSEKIMKGNTVIGVSGNATSDADATAADIMKDKTAYVNGKKIVGTYEEAGSSDINEFNAKISIDNSTITTFSITESLQEINNLDLTGITSMSEAFSGCRFLKKIKSISNSSKVTNMYNAFRSCGSKVETGFEIEEFDTSNVTNMQGLFQYSGLIKVPKLNTSKVTNMNQIFANMGKLKDVSDWDFSHTTDMNQTFLNSLGPEEFGDFNTINVENFNSTFYGCSNLKTLGVVNAEKANNINQALYGKYGMALQNFGGFKDLGKNYTQKTANYSVYKLDLSKATKLTHESLMNVINNLYDLNLTYDVANGGTLYTQQLLLGSTNLAKLTAEEIAIATAKRLVC